MHVVSRLSAVKPASFSTKLSFIVKQPAWAAAMSSSGLVPMPSANRELNEYWVLSRTVLWVVKVPFPSLPEPFQTAVAFRFIPIIYVSMFGLIAVGDGILMDKSFSNFES